MIAVICYSGCGKKIISGGKGEGSSINGAAVNGDISGSGKPVILRGNSVAESGIKDPENYTGTYRVSMSGYRGEIFIGISDGMFYGTIKFYNWGNGIPQPLKNLKVNEEKIYFVRSITSKEDVEKYGGTAMFSQEFYGIFSKDGKIVRGYYRYAGTQDSWEARRD